MPDYIDINVRAKDVDLDKHIAAVSKKLAAMQRRFERQVESIIKKSGIKTGTFEFVGPRSFYDKATGKFITEQAANQEKIRIRRQRKIVNLDAQQAKLELENIRIREDNIKELAKIGKKLKSPADLQTAIQAQISLTSGQAGRKTRQIVGRRNFAQMQNDLDRYIMDLAEVHKSIKGSKQKSAIEQIKVREAEAARLATKGRRLKDPVYLQRAINEQLQLFTTTTQGIVHPKHFKRIQANLDRYQQDLVDLGTTLQKSRRTNLKERITLQEQQAKQLVALGKRRDDPALIQRGIDEQFRLIKNRIKNVVGRRQFQRIEQNYEKYQQDLADLSLRMSRRHTQRARDADKARSQKIMGLASAGIGLFGTAGFPLLNIAFASMSGGIYAGIAAVTTAIGETVRFGMRLQDEAKQAAEGLHLLTKGFKKAQAIFEVTKAAHGVIQQPALQRQMENYTEFLSSSRGVYAESVMANLRAEYSSQFFTKLMSAGPIENLRRTFMPGGVLFKPVLDSFSAGKEDAANFSSNLKEARQSMLNYMNQYQARWESPEEMYRRISAAAASTSDESRKLLKLQLEKLDELIRVTKNQREQDNLRLYGFTGHLENVFRQGSLIY